MEPRILVDMDGVLVFSNRSHLEKINKEFNKDYKFEDISSFGYEFMEDEERERVFELWGKRDYQEAELADGAQRALDTLSKYGNIYVVSSPMVGHIESKFKFLLDIGLRKNQIVLTRNKALLMDYCPTVMIDDGPHNFKYIPDHVYSVVFDKPWNQDVEARFRSNNWHQILHHLKSVLESDYFQMER